MKGGLRATDDFEYAAESRSRPYVVGPMAVVTLPLGFSFEFDALYRRSGYSAASGNALYSALIREVDNVWEFPLLARHRIPIPAFRPYAEAGWAPRVGHGSKIISGYGLSAINPYTYTPYFRRDHTDWRITHGVVVGGGIQIPAGRLQFSPELRYTHWNRQVVFGNFPDGPGYGSSQDQLDVLLGISWRVGK